jgi:hypothetical protein
MFVMGSSPKQSLESVDRIKNFQTPHQLHVSDSRSVQPVSEQFAACFPPELLFLFRSRLCHYSVGGPGGTLVSMNRFSTMCG